MWKASTRLSLLAVALACAAVWSEGCKDNDPIPTVAGPAPQAVTPQAVTPQTVSGAVGHVRTAEENRGLRVEIIHDEWGPDCQTRTSAGTRTFKLTNESQVTKYSRLAAYTDPGLTCATQHTPTGKPNHSGCTEIQPGETCEFSVTVTMPDCGSLQVDDCWGPGGIQECSFVVGEGFRAPDPCDGCVENGPYEKCEGFGECHRHEDDEKCYEHAECTRTFDCKDPEPFEKTRPCDCECVENGPYEGEIVWSGEILKGACPEKFSTSCEEKCHELGTQKITWDCQDPTYKDHCRPADCPKPEGLCHVSNKGDDRNMNMVITRHGHQHHTNRCPPDLPNSQCNCDNVIAAAEACNPGATNYSCKDVR
jgi:hypothetical protein